MPFHLRRRWVAYSALACGLVLTTIIVMPIALGWTAPPSASRESALRALDAARATGAPTWSPELLRHAEATLHEGLEEYRRQQARLLPLRNFEEARLWLREAEAAAEHAGTQAEVARSEARDSAALAIERAITALDEAEHLSESVRLGRSDRRHLQQARAALAEARARFAAEDFRGALPLADEAQRDADTTSRGAVMLAARFVDENEVQRWRRWVDETIAWSRETRSPAVIVYKEKNLLTLYDNGRPVRNYAADMGQNRLQAKIRAGDKATPEGRYRITVKKDVGRSRYHQALLLDYPNDEDRRRLEQARRKGLVSHRAGPGNLIEIHGEGGRGEDWTNGCVALSNREMNDLFKRVGVGTPVTIVGGDGRNGTFSNIVRHLGARSGLVVR